MKNVFLILVLCLINVTAYSQFQKDRYAFIGVGAPLVVGMFFEDRQINLEAGVVYKLFPALAIEGRYTYTQGNQIPNYHRDYDKMFEFLSKNESKWFAGLNSMYLHSIGPKIHYTFVSNPKWLFSFSMASGISFANSSRFSLKSFKYSYNSGTGESTLVEYEGDFINEKETGIFFSPELNLHRQLSEKYIFKFSTGVFKQRETGDIATLPWDPYYFHFNFGLGIRF
jgi:hypothetical protein